MKSAIVLVYVDQSWVMLDAQFDVLLVNSAIVLV